MSVESHANGQPFGVVPQQGPNPVPTPDRPTAGFGGSGAFTPGPTGDPPTHPDEGAGAPIHLRGGARPRDGAQARTPRPGSPPGSAPFGPAGSGQPIVGDVPGATGPATYRPESAAFGVPTGGHPGYRPMGGPYARGGPGHGAPARAAGARHPAPVPGPLANRTGSATADPPHILAILSLVFAFCTPPAGLILGIIARRQIAQSGDRGEGMALAGIIVGAVVFLGLLIWAVCQLIALRHYLELLATPQPLPPSAP